MGYVEQNLVTGERVAYRTQLHWVLFVGPLLVIGFCLIVGVSMLFNKEGRDAIVLWAIVVMVSGVVFLMQYVKYRTSEFAVTNKRVIIKVGIFRRRSVEILLAKVEAVGVDQPLMGRMLGYGSITVSGTGGTKEIFHQIDSPLDFRRKVQEQTAQ